MSGLAEIIQWVINEIDLEVFDSAEAAFSAISDIFESDGRLDLDSILLEDRADFVSFLADKIEIPFKETAFTQEIREALTEFPEFTAFRIENAMVALFG